MKPKKGWHSRTNNLHSATALAALVMAAGTKWMPGVLTVETAALIAGGLLAAFASLGALLKADDRRKEAARKEKATVGDILAAQAAKPAGKVSP